MSKIENVRLERGVDMLHSPLAYSTLFSESVRLAVANGWSVYPQERVGQRRPSIINGHMFQWGPLQKRLPSEQDIADFCRDAPGANTACIMGESSGYIFAVDIDCKDAKVSSRIQEIAKAVLGHTPLSRVGNPPKIALFYRYDENGCPEYRNVTASIPRRARPWHSHDIARHDAPVPHLQGTVPPFARPTARCGGVTTLEQIVTKLRLGLSRDHYSIAGS